MEDMEDMEDMELQETRSEEHEVSRQIIQVFKLICRRQDVIEHEIMEMKAMNIEASIKRKSYMYSFLSGLILATVFIGGIAVERYKE
jgi:hypothetical protein